ncbi:hypothetical protein MPH47_09765 [Psychrobacillus psychrodurans]|uniref:hypothetical protein n=1 Tax=Psychrobacillus psychrodurans TaxID=126157 RepID=UPI001F4F0BDA|nr:hypothetical protein [Psychrobacillus psychrodurans]MCK1997503.1 hypothetical protein [Psychrobacillus psychrodurans]
MNNLNREKAFQQTDYTLYSKLFSAVMNVENAVRLLVYDNMKLLQLIKHFSNMPSVLSICHIRNLLEQSPPKHDFEFYMAISNHLREFERCMRGLMNE